MASASAQLSQLLLAAASGDARVRQPAQERLHELESRATFLPALLETYATWKRGQFIENELKMN